MMFYIQNLQVEVMDGAKRQWMVQRVWRSNSMQAGYNVILHALQQNPSTL